MENAVEALKFAAAVMLFAVALTLCISSFSQANDAVNAIISSRDRENDYTYVTPADDLTRKVGVETVVTSMYRAYRENIEIHFFEANGNEMFLYTDENGFDVTKINPAKESNDTTKAQIERLDKKLNDGLYQRLANHIYIESFGEYYEDAKTEEHDEIGEIPETTKIKKRVITYTIIP